MPDLSRRRFLKATSQFFLAASSLLGLRAIWQFFGFQADTPQTQFDLGPASAYPPGSRTILTAIPAVLIHTEAGFRAISLTCTHLGCTLQAEETGFICACHGSRFGVDGEVLHGPAKLPLPELRVEVNATGNLILR